MKTLLVLRHGTSPEKAANDWSRPLARSAKKRDLPRVAEFIHAQGIAPEWILSSDARRARETTNTFSEHFSPTPEVVLSRALYLATPEGIATEIQALPSSVSTAVVVGHNAGLEDFAEVLGGPLPAPLSPAGLCIFQLDIESWLDLHPSLATRTAFVNAQELR